MALLPQPQPGLIKTGQMARRQRGLLPQGQSITPEQIGQWARENPLDAAALATSPLPVVGDVVGFAADAKALYDEPSWGNAGWLAAGLLPFVPAGTVKRVVGEGKKMYRGLGGAYDASKAGNYQMFTSSVDDAAEYARYGKDPTVVEAAIDRGNNLKISANGSNFNAISIDSFPDDVRAALHPSIRESGIARTDDIAYAAQKAGYDSVTINDVVDSRWGEKGSGKPVTVEAVFDPKRVTASNIDMRGSGPAKMTAEDDALLADLLGNSLPTDEASRKTRK